MVWTANDGSIGVLREPLDVLPILVVIVPASKSFSDSQTMGLFHRHGNVQDRIFCVEAGSSATIEQ